MPRTFLLLLVCALAGAFIGRRKGFALQGFFLGLAFGPLGVGLVFLLPALSRPTRQQGYREAFRQPSTRPEPPSGGCPRCGQLSQPGAKVCAKCGNVLLPIHYEVLPSTPEQG